jgi:hypothetical protein
MTTSKSKRKPKREKPKKETPDLYARAQLLRPDRKPVGGWIAWGKTVRLKGVGGIG